MQLNATAVYGIPHSYTVEKLSQLRRELAAAAAEEELQYSFNQLATELERSAKCEDHAVGLWLAADTFRDATKAPLRNRAAMLFECMAKKKGADAATCFAASCANDAMDRRSSAKSLAKKALKLASVAQSPADLLAMMARQATRSNELNKYAVFRAAQIPPLPDAISFTLEELTVELLLKESAAE